MISAFGVDHGSDRISKMSVPKFKIGRTPGPPKFHPTAQPKGGVLNPKAPPYNPMKHMEQQLDRISPEGLTPWQQLRPAAKEAKRRGRRAGDATTMMPRGPHANAKELKALSGSTPKETLSRFGRATRRQDKEFSALIHPVSGRMEGLMRGDHASATLPYKEPTRSTKRMLELSQKAKSKKVRQRASQNLRPGGNPNIVGPKRIWAHNHPDNPGGHAKLKRSYPSAQDTGMTQQLEQAGMGYNNVVTTRRDAPRGGNKTQLTYFRSAPEQIRLPRRMAPKGKRLIEGDPEEQYYAQLRRHQHDLTTQPKKLSRVARGNPGLFGTSRRAAQSNQRFAIAEARAATGKKRRNQAWDDFMRKETAKPKKAMRSGIYTRTDVTKSAFDVVHKGPLTAVGDNVAEALIRSGTKRALKAAAASEKFGPINEQNLRQANKIIRRGNHAKAVRNLGMKMAEHSRATGAGVLTGTAAGTAGTGYAITRRKK